MIDSDSALLDEFCDHLWLEDGLSKNTLEAYRRDLALFGDWLARERARGLLETREEDLSAYFAFRYTQAQAARELAGAAAFQPQALLPVSPCAKTGSPPIPTLKLDTPKKPQRFPKSLTEADVEALLAAPDVESALGLRDRAMLEMLYATGLARVRTGGAEADRDQPGHGRGARVRQGRQGAHGADGRGSVGLAHALPEARRGRGCSRARSPTRRSSPRAARR